MKKKKKQTVLIARTAGQEEICAERVWNEFRKHSRLASPFIARSSSVERPSHRLVYRLKMRRDAWGGEGTKEVC